MEAVPIEGEDTAVLGEKKNQQKSVAFQPT
jgi:hypothetical protein